MIADAVNTQKLGRRQLLQVSQEVLRAKLCLCAGLCSTRRLLV